MLLAFERSLEQLKPFRRIVIEIQQSCKRRLKTELTFEIRTKNHVAMAKVCCWEKRGLLTNLANS